MVQLSKRYKYEHEEQGEFVVANITIGVAGPTSAVVDRGLVLITDALAPFALRVCGECGTVTPCECGHEDANTFQAALEATGRSLYEVEEGA